MSLPAISTVILNWNRSHLLAETLRTYAETVSVPHELYIVDNASSDDSRKIIRAFAEKHPVKAIIELEENLGGEALNRVIPKMMGQFIHISENDQHYLPGWCEKIIKSFAAFPKLGQLCLYGPVPTEAEAWVEKPVEQRTRNGEIVFHALTNVVTSSIIRRGLFVRGLTIHNVPSASDVRLPDDARLTRDIAALGYWSAYCDRYYVKNLGHDAKELRENYDYYRASYAAKGHIGVRDLDARLADKENSERHAFLRTLVQQLKPARALETGGRAGVAKALAEALPGGSLTILEHRDDARAGLKTRFANAHHVRITPDRSERHHDDGYYDLIVFDDANEDPEEEILHLLAYMKKDAIGVFFNSAATVAKLTADGLLAPVALPCPEGVQLAKPGSAPGTQKHRLIFAASSGRSGTQYLTHLLKGFPGLFALHEPEPKYQWETKPLQQDPGLARRFVRDVKLPWIRGLPKGAYLEMSHYICKGFLEAFWAEGETPDLLLLTRNPRDIAISWFALGADFHRDKSYVLQHMLHPAESRAHFLPVMNWESLTDYQLCYWYALESEARAAHYAAETQRRGGRTLSLSLEELTQGQRLEELSAWLNLPKDAAATLLERSRQRRNDKQPYKSAARLERVKTLDLAALERDVRQRCGLLA